ncbi:hypothetical protein POTOM_044458 [Populus tomentosa]|uniref:UBC core domain-containing protein n=1 Tax=Populus tomentosa TaxID=118781 RepID=A0A8X7YNE1_POPTO|nr:hypothetical protein POTOM_044458 [Populus tomentosa]
MDATEYEETYVEGIEEIEDDADRRFKRFKSFLVLQYPPHDHQFRQKQTLRSWMLSATGFGEHANPRSSFSETLADKELHTVGLFFFYMFFPPEYPDKPPEIFYHAPDFDLSPSLHQDGRVSLSLLSLNQWYRFRLGGKQQSWNPEQSDISRVLLSIQRLILNDKPYLNDSICDYGDFVLGHFGKRAHRILLIYKDQMLKHKGDNGMKQLFFKLVKAFESNGAYCQHHCSKTEVEQLQRERLKTGDFPWKNVPNEEHVSNFT